MKNDKELQITEKESLILEYMSGKVGTSIDKMESNASEQLKFTTSILTVLTAIATFFKVNFKFMIIPILCLLIGIIGFIKTVEPIKMEYVVGEVDSSVEAYNKLVNKKQKWIKIAYYACYIGIIFFSITIVA